MDFHWSDVVMFLIPLVVGIGLTGAVGAIARNGKKESPVCGKRAHHQPPGWVFAVVWPILYVLLGAGLALVWREVGRQWTPEVIAMLIGVVGLQVWWFVFSFRCYPWGAFGFLIGLLVWFIGLAIQLTNVSLLASMLLIPLIAWLSFASFLSFEIATDRTK